MIKLIVFDMDGLLVDSERQIYVRVGMEVSEEIGHPVAQEFLISLMGGSWDSYLRHFKEEYGEDYPIDAYWDRYSERIRYIVENEQLRLRPGAQEILAFCKENGIRTAIATTTKQEMTEKVLKNTGIGHYFDFVINGSMVSHSKPDPELFLKAIAHFDLPIEEALVFEDGHNGAQAAIRGHCRYIMVQDLAHLTEEDKSNAIMVIDDIRKAIPYIRKENERTAGIQAATQES
ncbi:MAG: HAD family phosphatase [Erysipelotrichaceae bacterium]|nr:HAD family phosphatase [Erysipelotrichaceae bacterium]